jgi:hypothetical protein
LHPTKINSLKVFLKYEKLPFTKLFDGFYFLKYYVTHLKLGIGTLSESNCVSLRK